MQPVSSALSRSPQSTSVGTRTMKSAGLNCSFFAPGSSAVAGCSGEAR